MPCRRWIRSSLPRLAVDSPRPAPALSINISTAKWTPKWPEPQGRPIPSGRVRPANALIFGLALVAWSALILALFVNWLAAGLAFLGMLYYVILYTVILKRNTVVNILIGGGAGAMPVLVGWAAASGALAPQALHPVRHRVLLDAAAFLGAGDYGQQRLCRRPSADDASRPRRTGDPVSKSSSIPFKCSSFR